VALCRRSEAQLVYPPTTINPCSEDGKPILTWRKEYAAIGATEFVILFHVNPFTTFFPLIALFAISILLSFDFGRFHFVSGTKAI
jgi:hypothetical protein